MKKLFLIFGFLFLLMVSVVSAESNLVYEWKFQNSLTDNVSSFTLDALAAPTYLSTPKYTSEGVLITTGGIDPNNRIYANYNTLGFDFTSNHAISLWIEYYPETVASNYRPYVAWRNGTPKGGIGTVYSTSDPLAYIVCDTTTSTGEAVLYSQLTSGSLYNIVCNFDGTDDLYFNYTNATNSGTYSPIIGDTLFVIGAYYSSDFVSGNIFNVKIYNSTLTDEQIHNIYLYNDVDGAPTPQHNYSINLTQTPIDLNFFTIGNFTVEAEISDSVGSIPNTTSATINYLTHNSSFDLYQTCYLYNNSCYDNNVSYSMTKVNDSYFTNTINEVIYLPAYYPFDENIIQSTVKSNYQLYASRVLFFNLENISTNSDFYTLEFNADPFSTSLSDDLHIGVCSYKNVSNCTLIDIILSSDTNDHTHGVNSGHYVVNIPSYLVQTNMTIKFYFETSPTINERWNFKYFTNVSYVSSDIFQTSTDGISFVNTSNIFDIHVHNYGEDTNLTYIVNFDDGEGNTLSVNDTDDLQITNLQPSGVEIDYPVGTYVLNSTGVNIFFNWSESIDPNNDSVLYLVGIGNGIPETNLSTYQSATNYTHTFTNTDLTTGDYKAYVYITDGSLTRISRQDIAFSVCVSNWVAVNGLCIDGIQDVNFTDSNSCSIEYDKPSSYQQNCIIETGNSNITLIIIWGIFGLLCIYFISKGHMSGWFFLGLIVMLFSFTTLQDITDEQILYFVGYIFSFILMAFALMNNTLK